MEIGRIDPRGIRIRAEYVAALNDLRRGALRGGRPISYPAIAREARKLAKSNPRYCECACHPGTVQPWVEGKSLPDPVGAKYGNMELFLLVCGVGSEELPRWKDALVRVRRPLEPDGASAAGEASKPSEIETAEPHDSPQTTESPGPDAPQRDAGAPRPVGLVSLGGVLGLGALVVLIGVGGGPASEVTLWFGLVALVVMVVASLVALKPEVSVGAVAAREKFRQGRVVDLDEEVALALWADELERRLRRELGDEVGGEQRLRVPWRVDADEAAWAALHHFARDALGPGQIGDPSTWAIEPGEVHGHDAGLAEALLRMIPTRRLVLVGESGSGKTILLRRLSLALIARARAGDGPYPLPLALSSWDPKTGLADWLVEQLVSEHPALGRRARGDERTVAQVLIHTGRLLPVLDGLDEMGGRVARNAAVRQINSWLDVGGGPGLVLAGRPLLPSDEEGPEVGPTNTPVVSIDELDPDSVRDYLTEPGMSGRETDSGTTWRRLLAKPDDPVAVAMRRPLSVGLARSVYRDHPVHSQGDALKRFAEEQLPTAAAVRAYLVGYFLPSRFDRHQRWTWEQARRWLVDIARVTRQPPPGCSDHLVWWELRNRVPWPLVPVMLSFPPALAVGLVAALDAQLGMGIGLGVLVGTLVGVVTAPLLDRPTPLDPVPVDDTLDVGPGIASGFLAGAVGSLGGGIVAVLAGVADDPFLPLMGGLGAGIAAGAAAGPRAGALGGLAGGVTVAFTAGLGQGVPAGVVDGLAVWLVGAVVIGRSGRKLPARALRRSDLRVAWWTGATVGLVIGWRAWTLHGLPGVLVAVGVGVLGGYAAGLSAEPVEPIGLAADPRAVLRTDRSRFLRMFAFGGGAFGLGATVAVTPWVGLAAFVTVGMISGALRTTWPAFAVARIWLAATRCLPLRLMTFLDDARSMDILRRHGAGYRLRHSALSEHLLDEPGNEREVRGVSASER